MFPIPKVFLVPAIVVILVVALWAWCFATWSEVSLSIDNQTDGPAVVEVYIDGEGFEDMELAQMMGHEDEVDFRESFHVTRGAHTLLVRIVAMDLEYRCSFKFGVLPSTESVALTLTDDYLRAV